MVIEYITTDDNVTLAINRNGSESLPVLILSNSVGTDMSMWDHQADSLSSIRHVVRYDTRGHGNSDAPEGEYTLERLAADVIAIADHLNAKTFDFAGVSLGGMTGLWLARYAPSRISHVVSANATAYTGGPKGGLAERIERVRAGGMAVVVDEVTGRWFTPEFQERDPDTVADLRGSFLNIAPNGYCGCLAALRDTDLRQELGKITVPTLLMGGRGDERPSPATIEAMAASVPGGQSLIIDGSHLSNIEDARGFDAGVTTFLQSAS